MNSNITKKLISISKFVLVWECIAAIIGIKLIKPSFLIKKIFNIIPLKFEININYRIRENKQKDVYIKEYNYIFSSKLGNILKKHEILKSECFICAEEDIYCIKCDFDHHTCLKCLSMVDFACEACRKSF